MNHTNHSYIHSKRLQSELQAWLSSSFEQWNYSVTFNFNIPGMKLDEGRIKLKLFGAKIDKEMFGKHYRRLCPETERNFFIAFPEHIYTNLHYHGLVRSPDPQRFREIADDIWQSLNWAGNIHFHENFDELGNLLNHLTDEDVAEAGSYITKEAYLKTQYENFVVSSDFAPKLHS